MVKESGERIICQTVISMKATIAWTKSMDMVYSIGKLEMYIKAIIKMTLGRDMVKCFGLMDPPTKVNGVEVFNMAMEF